MAPLLRRGSLAKQRRKQHQHSPLFTSHLQTQCDQLPCGHHSQSLSHCHAPWTDCISQTWESKSTFPSSSHFYQMLCHSNENRRGRGRRGEEEEAMHQAFHTLAIHFCSTGFPWIWFLSWQHSNIACDIHFTIMPRTLWVTHPPPHMHTSTHLCSAGTEGLAMHTFF